jgi:uncharacterized membrane protein
MIRQPLQICAALIGIEASVLFVSSRPRLRKYFSFLPPVFWIYFLPMLCATSGLLDPASTVYAKISEYLLAPSLCLLLLSSDVKAIIRLGPRALAMMLCGSFGIMLGTVAAVFMLGRWLGPHAWAGFGSLSGSWIGGSANMIAVKESLSTPDAVFAPMVVVDTIVPYTWMGILVLLAALQPAFDRWNRADGTILRELAAGSAGDAGRGEGGRKNRWLAVACIAAGAAVLSRAVSGMLPEIPNVLSRYAWTIICVSCIGIALSFTRLRSLGTRGATSAGYYLLYFVLTSIGARATLDRLGGMALFIGAGFLIVAIHGIVLLIGARLMRAPLFLVAAASQANIGGVASAPVVAAMYQPGLASVGLLLAILGNIIGTYLGIITGRLCYLIK